MGDTSSRSRLAWETSRQTTFESRPEGSEEATQLHERTCQAEETVGSRAGGRCQYGLSRKTENRDEVRETRAGEGREQQGLVGYVTGMALL